MPDVIGRSSERIVIVTPGGIEGGGGIGRMMGYVVDGLCRRGHGRDVVVMDARGAGSVLLSPFCLLDICLRLGRMMLAPLDPLRLHGLHHPKRAR